MKILLRLVAVLLLLVKLSSCMYALVKETITIPKAEAMKGYTAFVMLDADGDGPRYEGCALNSQFTGDVMRLFC